MLEEMTLDELRAEHKRAAQLCYVCEMQGFMQAASIWRMTANAIAAELSGRMARGEL